MARPKRFELLTPRFVVWCSIQLSYGRPCASREMFPTAQRRPERGHTYRLGRGKARQAAEQPAAPLRAQCGVKRSGMMRCRPGIVTDAGLERPRIMQHSRRTASGTRA